MLVVLDLGFSCCEQLPLQVIRLLPLLPICYYLNKEAEEHIPCCHCSYFASLSAISLAVSFSKISPVFFSFNYCSFDDSLYDFSPKNLEQGIYFFRYFEHSQHTGDLIVNHITFIISSHSYCIQMIE